MLASTQLLHFPLTFSFIFRFPFMPNAVAQLPLIARLLFFSLSLPLSLSPSLAKCVTVFGLKSASVTCQAAKINSMWNKKAAKMLQTAR